MVDDQPLVLTAIARVLEEQGHDVVTAVNGEEALRTAEDKRPDLIITDIRMPVMDGWGLVRQLRSRAEFTLTPVIILTDHDTSDSRMQGFRLGADDFVPKSIIVQELEVRIDRALARCKDIERMLSAGGARSSSAALPVVDHAEPDTTPDAPPPEEETVEDTGDDGFGLDLPPLAVAMGQKPSPVTAEPQAAVVSPAPEPKPKETGVGLPGMTGTLDQVGMASILTLLSSGEKSGVLTLSCPDDGRRAKIILREGEVLQIRVDGHPDLVHADGIAEMMRWRNARFGFVMQDVKVVNEVKTPTEHLLMEASRLMDEGES